MTDVRKMKADWQSHHILGYARAALEAGKPGYFDAPLISHIEGNLWTGGCINGVVLPDSFVRVFSLYPWERYVLGDNTERVEVEMYDSDSVPNREVLDGIVDQIVASLNEGPTLVHCQAGLNRSGLLSALVLMRLGRSAKDAIALLRERRHEVVLCNQTFENWLLEEA